MKEFLTLQKEKITGAPSNVSGAEPQWVYFGDIECLAIEKQFKEFAFSDEDAQFRYMNLGKQTIDVKEFQ